MAVLTPIQLTKFRQALERDTETQGWTKAEANSMIQAVEDEYENTAKAGFVTAIETAVPGKTTNAEKKIVGKHYFAYKFSVGG